MSGVTGAGGKGPIPPSTPPPKTPKQITDSFRKIYDGMPSNAHKTVANKYYSLAKDPKNEVRFETLEEAALIIKGFNKTQLGKAIKLLNSIENNTETGKEALDTLREIKNNP